ncbi:MULTISPECIES: autotransporter domain-containing protein [unclassified Rhizobium]|uniref:autotransporter domain-containing protein n=1 Tax=unclassified Rhizobium TaxID=2613769 RepID=UPI002889652E|nr:MULTISPECIES: autotransporter domain-containing protein [unclassified Rhizobium]
MTMTSGKPDHGMSRNTRRLFSTTSLIALALAASAAFPLSVQAIGGTPAPDTSNTSANTTFDQFTQPDVVYNPKIIGLSGDGSTLLVTGYGELGYLPYLWNGSAGSSPVITSQFNASDINEDGSVYVGSGLSNAYRVKNGVIEDLGAFGNDYQGVSDDGNALFGHGYVYVGPGGMPTLPGLHAFYWSTASGAAADGVMVDIGTLHGSNGSNAKAISGDGATVVGYSDNEAFRWRVGGTITGLGVLVGDGSSKALAVSADGSVVAGTSTGGVDRVFRWTDAGGMRDIGNLTLADEDAGQGINFGRMSADGSTIVGSVNVSPDNKDPSYTAAYRWHVGSDGITGTMQNLGGFGGGYAEASAVNADGSVVVGSANDTNGLYHGFRSTEATGLTTVEDWLRANGATIAVDTTATAESVSNNGNVVAGMTQNGQFYYARVDALGAGIITPEQFVPTIQSAAATPTTTQLGSANTAMFGAQGSPMRNLLNAGQRSAWGTVDSGYDKSDASDGGFGLGEIGMGYGIADGVTGRFAIGGTYTNQDLEGGGDFNFKGFYLSPEVTANVVSNLYVTLGGYYAGGKMDIHRGYMNGGAQDFSNGNTDTQTFGGKLRFDWLDAVTIADTAISPYIGLSRANSKVDAYTESGGSFPVAYDEMSDHATIARLGADYVHPLSDSITLLARTEVAHRFEDKSSATSANILGLSSVDLPGQDLKQWWVRGGLGAEFAVGGGTASLMVNASTEGGDPSVWLRSGWKVNF